MVKRNKVTQRYSPAGLSRSALRKCRLRRMFFVASLAVIVICVFLARPLFHQYQLSPARQAIDERDPRLALSLIAEFEESHGKMAEVSFLRARALRHSGAYFEAEAAMREARSSGCSASRVDRELLLLQAESGQLPPDDPKLRQLMVDPGNDAREIYEALVKGYFRLTKAGPAALVLDVWHQSFPDDPQPFYYGGALAEQNDQLQESIRWYRQAVALAPGRSDLRRHLAQVELELLNYRQAFYHFKLALGLREEVESLWGLGKCLKAQGKLELAREAFLQGLKVKPNHIACMLALGEMEIEAGRGADSLVWLEPAAQLEPKDYDVRYALGKALLFAGRTNEAKPHFQFAATARQQLTRINELQEQATLHPDDAKVRYEIGIALAEYGNLQGAASWLRDALKCDAGHELAREALANLERQRSPEE